MTLIDNAKDWWRLLSVRMAALVTIVQLAWEMTPEQTRVDMLGAFFGGEKARPIMAVLSFALIVWGRLKAQPDLHQ